MSFDTAAGLTEELRLMADVLGNLGAHHRIVMSYDPKTTQYTNSLEVAEACMVGGWMPIKDMTGLVKWLSTKVR